jgi:hypothetical protein
MALPARYAENMKQLYIATVAINLSVKIAACSTSGATDAVAATRMFSAVPATMIRKKTYGRVCTDGFYR